jgi:hypothetical protein
LEGLPLSPISTWDIASQIRHVLACPNTVTNLTWQYTKEAYPRTADRVYGEFSSSEWWERAYGSIPEIQQQNHYLYPISIFIDGAHLDQIGGMCVGPVIIELLGLWSDLRRTYKYKALLGFLPPYHLLTAGKNLEAQSLKSKYK